MEHNNWEDLRSTAVVDINIHFGSDGLTGLEGGADTGERAGVLANGVANRVLELHNSEIGVNLLYQTQSILN